MPGWGSEQFTNAVQKCMGEDEQQRDNLSEIAHDPIAWLRDHRTCPDRYAALPAEPGTILVTVQNSARTPRRDLPQEYGR